MTTTHSRQLTREPRAVLHVGRDGADPDHLHFDRKARVWWLHVRQDPQEPEPLQDLTQGAPQAA